MRFKLICSTKGSNTIKSNFILKAYTLHFSSKFLNSPLLSCDVHAGCLVPVAIHLSSSLLLYS